MVSEKFISNLEKLINKRLKKVVTRSPTFKTFGSSDDLPMDQDQDLATRFIPLRRSEYSAKEFLMATIPVSDPNLTAFHLATPILNVKKTSVQGVATFMAVVPYPVPETFIERMAVRLSHRLLPHDLVVQGMSYDDILSRNLIRYPAIVNINNDKRLCKTLAASLQCDVEVGGLSSSIYKVKLDYDELVSGVFTVVPYQGCTLLISKEAGQIGARADNPLYDLATRFAALSGVAAHIATQPQAGQEVGAIYADPCVELLLERITLPDPTRTAGGTPTGVAAMARGDLDWTEQAPPSAGPASEPTAAETAMAPKSPPLQQPIPSYTPSYPLPHPTESPLSMPHPSEPISRPTSPQPVERPAQQPIQDPAIQPANQPTTQTAPLPVQPQPTMAPMTTIDDGEVTLVHCPGCGTGLELDAGQISFVCPLCHNAYTQQD